VNKILEHFHEELTSEEKELHILLVGKFTCIYRKLNQVTADCFMMTEHSVEGCGHVVILICGETLSRMFSETTPMFW
jgi:hypothetical protein